MKFEEFDKDFNIINMKNGLYLIKEDKLVQHDPNYFSINQKPIVYNPLARPKLFGKFLSEVLYSTDIRTGVEMMAYTFSRNNLFEIYCILIGSGSNGKNVFTGILSYLHGLKNISNVSLTSIIKERFSLADLENKDVNIDTELLNGVITDISTLKKLTGKQPIRIERKNKDAYDVILHVKLFFSANKIPSIDDDSDARFRREIILSFPYQFEEGVNADPNKLGKLTTEEEMSGIFNIMMKALRNIQKTNRIHVNQKTIQERRENHELVTNTVKAFTENAVSISIYGEDYVTKENLHQAYLRFCKFYRLPIENKVKFGKSLKKIYPSLEEGRDSSEERNTTWKGIRLVKWIDNELRQEEVML